MSSADTTAPTSNPQIVPTLPYLSLDLQQEINSQASYQTLYTVAYVTSLVALVTIGIGALGICGVYVPFYLPYVLAAIGSLIEPSYSFICAPLKNQMDLASMQYETSSKIQEKIDHLKTLSIHEILQEITRIGINPEDIQDKDRLRHYHAEHNGLKLGSSYSALIPLIARYQYWEDKTSETNDYMTQLKEEELQDNLMQISVKLYEVEEGSYLNCKIKAAFMLHCMTHPYDPRAMSDFGTIQPQHFVARSLHHLVHSNASNNYFFYPTSPEAPSSRPPETREFIRDHSIQDIAKKIFEQQPMPLTAQVTSPIISI